MFIMEEGDDGDVEQEMLWQKGKIYVKTLHYVFMNSGPKIHYTTTYGEMYLFGHTPSNTSLNPGKGRRHTVQSQQQLVAIFLSLGIH